MEHDLVNRAFATDGGAKQLDKLLGQQLDEVLETLAGLLWEASG